MKRWTKEERENVNKVRVSNRKFDFRYFPNNTMYHELMKFRVYTMLRDAGHLVITEAIFENNKRADVFDCSMGIIYEILHKEKELSLDKIKEYPCEIITIRSTDRYWYKKVLR